MLTEEEKTKLAELRAQKQAFLDDIVKVCEKHRLTISHEDGHGGFLIEEFPGQYFTQTNIDWLRAAMDTRADEFARKIDKQDEVWEWGRSHETA